MKPLRKGLLSLGLLCVMVRATSADQIVYDDANANGWDGTWSWATVNLANTSPVHTGTHSVAVKVDAAADRHPINPFIYGVAFASGSNQLLDLNVPLHRSGGNATTRYNWQINAANRGSDWYFESLASSSSVAGGDGDDFIQQSK